MVCSATSSIQYVGLFVTMMPASVAGEVDRVHADTIARDDPAFRHLRHDVGRDGAGVGVEQRIAVTCRVDELGGRLGLERHELGDAFQRFLLDVQLFPDVIGEHYFGGHGCPRA